MCHKLRAGFAVRIRIITIKRFIFTIAPFPLVILVHLICRDIQKRFYAGIPADTLTDIHRSHYIRLISVDRILVRIADDRLCRQMKYDLRLCIRKHLCQMIQITDITDTEFICLSTSHSANRFGSVGALREYPVTSAPAPTRILQSQDPLNPVCPVISTFFPL